jgi:single-stranded DNA-binding protein
MEIIMTTTTTNTSITNSIVISSCKGNLVKDPVGPYTSGSGREYYSFTAACNNINKNEDDTWYPRVFCFGETMALASTLKKGDFIEISHALLNPGSTQDVWIDKEGNPRPQSDSLMVMPRRSEAGTVIPIKIIKRKEQPASRAVDAMVDTQTSVAPKQQNLPVPTNDSVQVDEASVLATISA